MRLITAIIQPDKLDDVIEAVTGEGARGLTVTEGARTGSIGDGKIWVADADSVVLRYPALFISLLAGLAGSARPPRNPSR